MSVNKHRRCTKKTRKGERCRRPIYYIEDENKDLCKLHFLTDMHNDDPFEPSNVSAALVIPGVYIGSISAAQKRSKVFEKTQNKKYIKCFRYGA